jgi:hypothetical protein
VKAEPRLQRPEGRSWSCARWTWRGCCRRTIGRGRCGSSWRVWIDPRPLQGQVKAVEGHAGRPPLDPAILMALWPYTTVEGGAARAVARLCEDHDVYPVALREGLGE